MATIAPKFFWPLLINSGNRQLVVNNGVGDTTCSLANGTYASAEGLRAALETAIRVSVPTANVYLTIGDRVQGTHSGRFLIESGGNPIIVKAGDALSNGYLWMGFFALTYNVGAVSNVLVQKNGVVSTFTGNAIIAPNQHQNGWYPQVPAREDTLPVRDRSMNVTTRAVAGQTKTILEVELSERAWVFAHLEGWKTYKDLETTNTANQAIERLWEFGYEKFRFFPNEVSEAGFIDYALTQDTARVFKPTRQFLKRGLYEFELLAWKYV